MPESQPLLTIVIPVFNECETLDKIVQRVLAVIQNLKSSGRVRALYHDSNFGKGASLRTAFLEAKIDFVLIQDADLEYASEDYPRLLQPLYDGRADVVYGSRFHGEVQRVHLFWHHVANGGLFFW